MARYTVQIHTDDKHDRCTCPEILPAVSTHRHKARALTAAKRINTRLHCARHIAVVMHHSVNQGDHIEG